MPDGLGAKPRTERAGARGVNVEENEMTKALRILPGIVAALWLAGCSQMIPIAQVNDMGTVERPLTKDQVARAIEEGARNAGWTSKNIGNDQIASTYRIRSHTVTVTIDYSEDLYRIHYKSSTEMKVQCSEKDWKASKNIIVTGRQSCPGFETPQYIHENYGQWIAYLKASIDHSLTFAD